MTRKTRSSYYNIKLEDCHIRSHIKISKVDNYRSKYETNDYLIWQLNKNHANIIVIDPIKRNSLLFEEYLLSFKEYQ